MFGVNRATQRIPFRHGKPQCFRSATCPPRQRFTDRCQLAPDASPLAHFFVLSTVADLLDWGCCTGVSFPCQDPKEPFHVAGVRCQVTGTRWWGERRIACLAVPGAVAARRRPIAIAITSTATAEHEHEGQMWKSQSSPEPRSSCAPAATVPRSDARTAPHRNRPPYRQRHFLRTPADASRPATPQHGELGQSASQPKTDLHFSGFADLRSP
jgi:hypothetical protein